MKKYLAIALAVVLVISVLSITVMAKTSGNYEYEVISETEKSCVITKYTGSTRNLVIPSSLDGYTVTEIGEYAFFDTEESAGNKDLRSVEIPASVKKIGRYAFNLCSGLNEVVLSEGLECIEEGAFFNCSNLKTINLPDSINYIGRNILYDTKVMPLLPQYEREDPTLPESELLFDTSTWTDGALYIGKHLICVDLRKSGSFSVKAGTKTIAGEAFYWCDKLTSVTIPNGVVSVGEYAFYNCDGIKSLYLPESITVIGQSAFDHCDKLQTINIPSKVNEIAKWTFTGCKALKSVTISGNIKRIGIGAYSACTSLETVKINSGVEEIGKAAFQGCTSLSSITIADSVKLIGQNAFGSTKYYSTSANWKNNTLSIGNHLIKVRNSVSGVFSVPSGTKAIAEDAFFDCKNLTEINIPSSVSGIYDGAFRNCTALKNISVATDNANYSAKNGMLYSKDGSRIICCPISNTASTLNVANNEKVISDYAFYGCKNLVEIKLSSNVNKIGTYAFYDCDNLSTITVPASVTAIGDWAFAASEKLTVYVQADTFAEGYVKANEIKYDYMGITIKDERNGVIVITENKDILPVNSQLKASVSKAEDGNKYSINVESDGQNASPNGSVTVKIAVPSGMDASACKVYFASGDEYTYVNAIVEDGYLVFQTTKLGDFLVTENLLTAIPGDVNGDGKISAIDARIVLQIAAEIKTATNEEIALADVNGDGKITAIDARQILKTAAGL
ncbi:MAG: leucine-rich repeat protein [Clostridia bacterium]|nr:leucine-rich repeat protein [Clostridia bacterium]